MSGDLDVPRSTCHHARHLATTTMEEDIRRTQQQSVPPQVPQVGRAGGETGASPSIRRSMLVASVVEAKKDKQGHFAVACPESVCCACWHPATDTWPAHAEMLRRCLIKMSALGKLNAAVGRG
jgi:hypothetical protein